MVFTSIGVDEAVWTLDSGAIIRDRIKSHTVGYETFEEW